MALYKLNSCRTPWLASRYGRSIVPNRSEPRATVASKTKQPNSPKTPQFASWAEPLGTMALHCKTPPLGRRNGRSIVPNRSEPRATAASKAKQPSSRKTPPLARRAEPLGTMALHCKTPPLASRNGRSIVPNRSEPRATAASKTKQPNSRKTPPLARRAEPLGTMALHCKMPPHARRAEPLGLTLEPIAQAHRVRGRPWGLGATFVPRAVC
jgi:hypothetical protein